MKVRFDSKKLCFQAYVNDEWINVNDGIKKNYSLDALKTIDRYRIEVSLVCNLRCEYCVVHMNSVQQQNTVMSIDTAKKIVKRFNSEVSHNGSIFLMGGEPLMNLDVVKYFVENIKGSTIIFTNALGLNEQLAQYFLKHNVYILTSLDGYSLEQNKKRFGLNSMKYEKVIKNIKYAISIGCKVGVSCLLHQYNIADATRIAEFFVNELHARSMSFAYPHMTIKESLENNFDMTQYADKQIELYEFAKNKEIYIDQIGKIVGAIVSGLPIVAACKAGLSQRTFYPNGDETVCTKIDTVDNFDLEQYFKSLPYFNDKCSDCIAVSLCGGGCAWDACAHAGVNGLDHRICSWRKRVVDYILEDIIRMLSNADDIDDARKILNNIQNIFCNNYN